MTVNQILQKILDLIKKALLPQTEPVYVVTCSIRTPHTIYVHYIRVEPYVPINALAAEEKHQAPEYLYITALLKEILTSSREFNVLVSIKEDKENKIMQLEFYFTNAIDANKLYDVLNAAYHDDKEIVISKQKM